MPRNQATTRGQGTDNATERDTANGRQGRTQRPGRGEHAGHEHRTAKVIDLIGTSEESFEDAVRCCIADAAATTRGITGAQVKGWSVKCEDGEITQYKAHVSVAFGVERT